MVSSSVLFFMKLYELIPLETNILNLLFLATGLNSIVFTAGNFWRSNSAFYPDWFSVKRTNNIESARRFLAGFIVALAGLSFLLIEGASGSWIFMIVFPPFMFLMSAIQVNDNLSVKNVRKIFDVFLQSPVFIAYTYFSLLFTAAMIMLLSDLSVFLSGIDFIHMLMSYSDEVFKWVEISILVVMLLAGLILSVLLLATGMLLVYFSALERIYAPGLTMQLKLLNLIKDETE
jgi:hypothetical protein